jgi:hypothetical protein
MKDNITEQKKVNRTKRKTTIQKGVRRETKWQKLKRRTSIIQTKKQKDN